MSDVSSGNKGDVSLGTNLEVDSDSEANSVCVFWDIGVVVTTVGLLVFASRSVAAAVVILGSSCGRVTCSAGCSTCFTVVVRDVSISGYMTDILSLVSIIVFAVIGNVTGGVITEAVVRFVTGIIVTVGVSVSVTDVSVPISVVIKQRIYSALYSY